MTLSLLSESALARACCEATLLADGAAHGPQRLSLALRASHLNPIGGPIRLSAPFSDVAGRLATEKALRPKRGLEAVERGIGTRNRSASVA